MAGLFLSLYMEIMDKARIFIPMIAIMILYFSLFATGFILLDKGIKTQKRTFKIAGGIIIGIVFTASVWFVYKIMNVQ